MFMSSTLRLSTTSVVGFSVAGCCLPSEAHAAKIAQSAATLSNLIVLFIWAPCVLYSVHIRPVTFPTPASRFVTRQLSPSLTRTRLEGKAHGPHDHGLRGHAGPHYHLPAAPVLCHAAGR